MMGDAIRCAASGTRTWASAGVAVLLLVAVPRGFADEDRGHPPSSRPADDDKWARHYHDRVAEFERENAEAKNIVLLGSSHIEGFDAAKLLPGRRVVNRGIAADRIGLTDRGILHRLNSSVFDCNPRLVILENGVNDLGELHRRGAPTLDEIERGYRRVVESIRRRRPDVPLVIVEVFPTRDRFADLKPLIIEFNGRLAKIAADFRCPFMAVFSRLADADGRLRPEYSRDGLHLNEQGYRLWAGLMEPYLPSAATMPAK